MKKIMMMLVAGFAISNMVVAADDVVDQIDDQEEVSAAGAFDGLYVGAGIGGSFLKNKHDGVSVDVTVTQVATGVSRAFSQKINPQSANANRCVGNIFAGYGKAINQKFYVGGELLLEITGKKDLEAVENKGFTPELALKAGYVANCNMFYAKAGIARPEASVFISGDERASIPDEKVKVSKIVPVVYLGAARAFGNGWNANIEVGYQFQQKKDIERNYDRDFNTPAGLLHAHGHLKADTKLNGGWKVRAGVARTFNF